MCSHYQALKEREKFMRHFGVAPPPEGGKLDLWPGYLGPFIRRNPLADARRKAVLEGLQKLGYQVQEGLSTMTTGSGRLIVRNPVSGDYGVELVTGANQKVQVRSIAFDAARDSSLDVAEERRWCRDFGKLQATLQAGGCDVVVEKALGVGATPLRVVSLAEEHLRNQASPGQAGRSR